ncbi:MAG: alkaline phosphatase PhoX [Woeseiaceae bacterium]
MIKRRHFLQSLVAAAASPAAAAPADGRHSQLGPLLADPNGLLDLPGGFTYSVVSRAGDTMSDKLKVPRAHDGMAAFDGGNGRVVLICNHELRPSQQNYSAFGTMFRPLPEATKSRVYDRGRGRSPGTGGTTTTIYNPASGETERQHLSLAGTEMNCAGGPTPWGSWLSCEECFEDPVTSYYGGGKITREKPHGYVFEVPANESGLVDPVPIKAMGRFEHEACAVHRPSGIVYMTEDRRYSLFYRFLPNVQGQLHEGGRLQALAIVARPSMQTHNWTDDHVIGIGEPLTTTWIDLDDVDPGKNDLRLRGAAAGAATFARGEGMCASDDGFAFACTIGGRHRLGQVFLYRPGPLEGQTNESEGPGQLTLLAESTRDSLLRNADNITMAPWGDLIACEDTASHCGLVGVRADGSQYHLADNAYSNSELAGACFAPDGKTLFVNIQFPGTTLAITGPWPT